MDAENVRRGVGCVLASTAYLVMTLLGLVIHVWTIVIAFNAKGLFAAVLSCIFPVIAQLYWGFVGWTTTGTLFNPYCLALLSYVFLWAIIFVGGLTADS